MAEPLLLVPTEGFRDTILKNPRLVLDDAEIMKALIDGGADRVGHDVLDLRTVALEQLSDELTELKDTHGSVVATAYDNVATTNHFHRAVLDVTGVASSAAFTVFLQEKLAASLRVDYAQVCIESPVVSLTTDPTKGEDFRMLATGEIDDYILGAHRQARPAPLTLRRVHTPSRRIYGAGAAEIQSEALLILPLGPDIRPALLALGSTDPQQFTANMGTDLLDFYRQVFANVLTRWLE